MTIKMGTLEHSLNKSLQQIEENDGIELDKNQWRLSSNFCVGG